MCSAIVSTVSDKFGVSFGTDYSFPKTKGNYKGTLPASVFLPVSVLKKIEMSSMNDTDDVVTATAGEPDTIVATASPVPPVGATDMKISSVGAVIPSPQTVLKTRRGSDGMKVFINVCAHDAVPKGKFHCLRAAPKSTSDKDGGDSAVVDICVNSADYNINSTSSDIEKSSFLTNILKQLNAQWSNYVGIVDLDFKQPKIRNNYKGNSAEPDAVELLETELIDITEDTVATSASASVGIVSAKAASASPTVPPSSSSSGIANTGSSAAASTGLTSFITAPPPLKRGWLRKKGHFVGNWKRRYMVLDGGKITYYEKEISTFPFGASEKGVFELRGMKTSVPDEGGKSKGPARLYISSGTKGDDLLLEVDSSSERDGWLAAVEQHIRFADAIASSGGSDRSSVSSTGSSTQKRNSLGSFRF